MSKGKETTSTDIGHEGLYTASESEAAAFKLGPHMTALLWDEPFFSALLRKVTRRKTDQIPTAGVLCRDSSPELWWNPRFLASLKAEQVKGLLKHECYHLVFEHTTTRRHEPHAVWNYATDLAINSLIPGEELPDCGLIPGQAFTPLTEEQAEKMGPEAVARWQKLSDLIKSFPTKLSSEEYFSRLMEDPEVQDTIQNGPAGEGEGSPGGPGMDDHAGWDELSDTEREFVRGKIKQDLADAVKECDSRGQWGSISAETRSTIRQLLVNDIPWQSVLKKFCGTTRRSDRTSNVRRLNRKYPGIHPGVQKGYTSSIAVYIDQSGSVDSDSLELLFGELRSLAKRTEFTVYHFDTSVDEKSETVWKKNRTPVTHRTRCGGTCFKAPSVHANKNSHRYDGYLILTDGEAYDPGPSKLKRGWVIIPNRALMFEASKRDFVVQMKTPKADKKAA